jgi:Mg2+/Co2+ transporter CorB
MYDIIKKFLKNKDKLISLIMLVSPIVTEFKALINKIGLRHIIACIGVLVVIAIITLAL